MAIFNIPRRRGLAETFTENLGGSIDEILNAKLNQAYKRQEAEEQYNRLGSFYEKQGLPRELAYAPQSVQGSYLKDMFQKDQDTTLNRALMGESSVQQVAPTTQMQQQQVQQPQIKLPVSNQQAAQTAQNAAFTAGTQAAQAAVGPDVVAPIQQEQQSAIPRLLPPEEAFKRYPNLNEKSKRAYIDRYDKQEERANKENDRRENLEFKKEAFEKSFKQKQDEIDRKYDHYEEKARTKHAKDAVAELKEFETKGASAETLYNTCKQIESILQTNEDVDLGDVLNRATPFEWWSPQLQELHRLTKKLVTEEVAAKGDKPSQTRLALAEASKLSTQMNPQAFEDALYRIMYDPGLLKRMAYGKSADILGRKWQGNPPKDVRSEVKDFGDELLKQQYGGKKQQINVGERLDSIQDKSTIPVGTILEDDETGQKGRWNGTGIDPI